MRVTVFHLVYVGEDMPPGTKMPMVQAIDDRFDEFADLGEVPDEAGFRIDGAADVYVQLPAVSMQSAAFTGVSGQHVAGFKPE
jgi:hypothetical protein